MFSELVIWKIYFVLFQTKHKPSGDIIVHVHYRERNKSIIYNESQLCYVIPYRAENERQITTGIESVGMLVVGHARSSL